MNFSSALALMAAYAAMFYLGRLSIRIRYDRHLEQKRQQLMAYRDELLDMATALELKDRQIREKWQNMVTDFSKYQASISGDTGKWTDMDDIYLDSWKSAEK